MIKKCQFPHCGKRAKPGCADMCIAHASQEGALVRRRCEASGCKRLAAVKPERHTNQYLCNIHKYPGVLKCQFPGCDAGNKSLGRFCPAHAFAERSVEATDDGRKRKKSSGNSEAQETPRRSARLANASGDVTERYTVHDSSDEGDEDSAPEESSPIASDKPQRRSVSRTSSSPVRASVSPRSSPKNSPANRQQSE